MKQTTNQQPHYQTIELLIHYAMAEDSTKVIDIMEFFQRVLQKFQTQGYHVEELQRITNDHLKTILHCMLQALETGGKAVSPAEAAPVAANAVAACFEEGLLDREKPNQLFLLLLAMRARHRWMEREIPAFVAMVRKQYPALEQFYGKTEEQIVWSIRNLQAKATHYFYERVHDQVSMQAFIDELYPLKKDGERRRNGQEAQILAEKLYLQF